MQHCFSCSLVFFFSFLSVEKVGNVKNCSRLKAQFVVYINRMQVDIVSVRAAAAAAWKWNYEECAQSLFNYDSIVTLMYSYVIDLRVLVS